MNIPRVLTCRRNGEYSTVVLWNGFIETCWFPISGDSRVIARSAAPMNCVTREDLRAFAITHVAEYEASGIAVED